MHIVENGANKLSSVAAGGGAVQTILTGLLHPKSVAEDAAGTIYVADTDNAKVLKIPAGSNVWIERCKPLQHALCTC